MGRVLVGAALLILASASYAWAAPPEGVLGAPMHARAGNSASPGAAPAGVAGVGDGWGNVARYSTALGALEPGGQAATRGAKEVKVYQTASPAVVLVLADDGFGSGALISADGKVITNLHVVGDADEVGVVFKPVDGDTFDEADVRTAKVIRRDEVTDLALLQVSEIPAGVTPLALGSAASVQVGSDVHAIGHPTGQSWTYTRGIVSQIRKDYDWVIEDKVPHTATIIQTQTPINPGNSGGPLIDDNLEIVGINSFKGRGEGLNFAVSADDVKAFLNMTADRLVEPRASADVRAAAAKDCEAQSLDEWPVKEPAGTAYWVDENCDDEGDFVVMIPDDKREAIMYAIDSDQDGVVDAIFYDDDRDGDFDVGVFDTDGDGEPDLRGDFKPGETRPYRYERIEPAKDRKRAKR